MLGMLYVSMGLPDIQKLYQDVRSPSIVILANDGERIGIYGNRYGSYIPYQQFPPMLINAVVSTEDRRFFSHSGVDMRGLVRAMFVNLRAGKVVQGGSTITQQLAKVVFLSPERTFKRKFQELLLALYIEKELTKEEILTLYLNRIYFGAGNYGVDAAAHFYFNKPVEQLTLFESAVIAGLIQAPSRYSPVKSPELAKKRAEEVLQNMVENNVMQDKDIAGDFHPVFASKEEYRMQQYPYYTDWIFDQIKDYVGRIEEDIIVTTTLDRGIQDHLSTVVTSYIAKEGKELAVSQAAGVVMQPGGKIVALAGGTDYQQSQFNRATQALRQPGSAFKLFVYLSAFEKGYTPDYTLMDAPISIKGWSPENYDKEYAGEVTLEEAFTKSINTVAVRLAQEVGINNIVRTARKLGITSDISPDLSTALGTSEVSLLELTNAYAHMANYGYAVWPYGIERIETKRGEVLYEREGSAHDEVISAQATAYMDQLLLNVVVSGTGRNAQPGFPVAGKTGTSQQFRDAWFIGFSKDYVAGIWVGNDDNTPMDHVGGGGLPARMWKDVMATIGTGGIFSEEIPVSPTEILWQRSGGSLWDKFFGGKEEATPPPVEEGKKGQGAIQHTYPTGRKH